MKRVRSVELDAEKREEKKREVITYLSELIDTMPSEIWSVIAKNQSFIEIDSLRFVSKRTRDAIDRAHLGAYDENWEHAFNIAFRNPLTNKEGVIHRFTRALRERCVQLANGKGTPSTSLNVFATEYYRQPGLTEEESKLSLLSSEEKAELLKAKFQWFLDNAFWRTMFFHWANVLHIVACNRSAACSVNVEDEFIRHFKDYPFGCKLVRGKDPTLEIIDIIAENIYLEIFDPIKLTTEQIPLHSDQWENPVGIKRLGLLGHAGLISLLPSKQRSIIRSFVFPYTGNWHGLEIQLYRFGTIRHTAVLLNPQDVPTYRITRFRNRDRVQYDASHELFEITTDGSLRVKLRPDMMTTEIEISATYTLADGITTIERFCRPHIKDGSIIVEYGVRFATLATLDVDNNDLEPYFYLYPTDLNPLNTSNYLWFKLVKSDHPRMREAINTIESRNRNVNLLECREQIEKELGVSLSTIYDTFFVRELLKRAVIPSNLRDLLLTRHASVVNMPTLTVTEMDEMLNDLVLLLIPYTNIPGARKYPFKPVLLRCSVCHTEDVTHVRPDGSEAYCAKHL